MKKLMMIAVAGLFAATVNAQTGTGQVQTPPAVKPAVHEGKGEIKKDHV